MGNNKMGMFIVISLFSSAIAIAAAYFIGSPVELQFWEKGIKIAEWKSIYLKVVGINGLLVAISSIIWVVYNNISERYTSAGERSFRSVWIMLLMLSVVECIAVPFGLTISGYIPHICVANIGISFVLFMLAFYITTVFGTRSDNSEDPICPDSWRTRL